MARDVDLHCCVVYKYNETGGVRKKTYYDRVRLDRHRGLAAQKKKRFVLSASLALQKRIRQRGEAPRAESGRCEQCQKSIPLCPLLT